MTTHTDTLWSIAPTRRTDPPTSRNKVNRSASREVVRLIMADGKTRTDQEIESACRALGDKTTGPSLRRARGELVSTDHLVHVDNDGVTEAGNPCGRWKLNPSNH